MFLLLKSRSPPPPHFSLSLSLFHSLFLFLLSLSLTPFSSNDMIHVRDLGAQQKFLQNFKISDKQRNLSVPQQTTNTNRTTIVRIENHNHHEISYSHNDSSKLFYHDISRYVTSSRDDVERKKNIYTT